MRRRIAVTMRVDDHAAYGERRDALDQRWIGLLQSLGLTPVPAPNALADLGDWTRSLGIAGLLLTGGNDVGLPGLHEASAPERDGSEGRLLELAREQHWPVLGVCRGLQMINVHCGGGLSAVDGHVAIRHEVLDSPAVVPRFFARGIAGAASRQVNSFHGCGIAAADLATDLVPIYRDAQGWIEAVEHRLLPWAGLMWHPEREPALDAADRHLLNQLFANDHG
ncbi:MAG: gamma-glutamyl-gamma-aminobutyrate hydrolase family protein [Burkholderiales bacterium]|nr:gamma-glutamyl-gamma-aminobutyrate hydrolase family protein [Burkholderiales bacterium]